jgi:hypothetical protein
MDSVIVDEAPWRRSAGPVRFAVEFAAQWATSVSA